MRLKVDGWLGRVEFAVLPPACLLCGAAAGLRRDLCAPCAADLVRNDRACIACAIPLAAGTRCGRCARRPPAHAKAWVPFVYGAPIDQLLTRLKFRGDLAAGRVLAGIALARRPVDAALPDAIVPVPLHDSRLAERGYNQALELARPWALALHLPLLTDLVVRTRATPPQTGLSALARRRNLRNALRVTTTPPRHVAIVDDVMTTGTTLNETARALRRAGCEIVEAWAVARAPRVGRESGA